ncbi:MAG: cob(I)yrinic acid a,c-diamide adenosyltransferase [Bacilli bacterium]
MKLYTRTGDKGQTSLVGARVHKNDSRVETYGTIDEANSWIGRIICALQMDGEHGDLIDELTRIQHELFDCGGDLAQASEKRNYQLTAASITRLEKEMDAHTEACAALERFILPGGTPIASDVHIVRTVVRRAERLASVACNEHDTNDLVLAYLNRLSDYLFALARVINKRANVEDVPYERGGRVFR